MLSKSSAVDREIFIKKIVSTAQVKVVRCVTSQICGIERNFVGNVIATITVIKRVHEQKFFF